MSRRSKRRRRGRRAGRRGKAGLSQCRRTTTNSRRSVVGRQSSSPPRKRRRRRRARARRPLRERLYRCRVHRRRRAVWPCSPRPCMLLRLLRLRLRLLLLPPIGRMHRSHMFRATIRFTFPLRMRPRTINTRARLSFSRVGAHHQDTATWIPSPVPTRRCPPTFTIPTTRAFLSWSLVRAICTPSVHSLPTPHVLRLTSRRRGPPDDPVRMLARVFNRRTTCLPGIR